MGLLNPHLEDDDFADVWSARTLLGAQESDRPAESHLRKCAECRVRYDAFVSWLDGLRVEAQAETDEIFGRDRLAAQQLQIFRRLESLDHPARVIAFPKFARPVAVQTSGRRRWTAVAATVGLITGIGLGQLIEFRTAGTGDAPFTPRQIARGRFRRQNRTGTSSRCQSTTTRRSSSLKRPPRRSVCPNPCST